MTENLPLAEMVTVTIDGNQVTVPQGTLAIRAAEAAGIHVPRFCDHPLLDPVGACRQCLVDIVDAGNGRGFPTPQPACTTPVADSMVFNTQESSQGAAKAQADILELILMNHPLDCPVCDKGGECPLQNQAMSSGRSETRFDGEKNSFPKPIELSELILLDRERCVLCTRCTRFSDQISGDPMVQLVERGSHQQVNIFPDQPYDSYFSGNIVQHCPVGALTSADYRFSGRPFDLTSTPSTCENCASGCALRVETRNNRVVRRQAESNVEVNEQWSCDRGRFGFHSTHATDRVTSPLVRRDGRLVPTSWNEAIEVATQGLTDAGDAVGIVTSGRLTMETSYAYSLFARKVLATNSIDFRGRASSVEEAQFLASCVVGQTEFVSYGDLETASKVILVGFEPEDESPMVFLRLKKAVRKNKLVVETLSPIYSRASKKLGAVFTPTRPADLPGAIESLTVGEGTIILAGETLAQIPGALTAVAALVTNTGVKVAWIPRRAGEMGALEAGCLPDLLPGGHLVTSQESLDIMSAHWKTDMPTTVGLNSVQQMSAAAAGELKALIISGVEAADFADRREVMSAVKKAFTVSFETRRSAIACEADVVFPVAVLEETSGTFLNWEHRRAEVNRVVKPTSTSLTEIRILSALADALGTPLGFRTSEGALESFDEIPVSTTARPSITSVKPAKYAKPKKNEALVYSWRELLDDSRCLDGATRLRASARPPVVRMSAETARSAGLVDGSVVEVDGPHASFIMPVVIEPTMVPGVVWLPTHAPHQGLTDMGVGLGSVVSLTPVKGGKK